jgi:hypothetical protein
MNPIQAIWNLLFSEGEAERYAENPDAYLQETGLDQCDPAELHDLVVMAYEKGPVYQGANVNVGGNQGVGGSSQSAGPGGGSSGPGPSTAPSAPPPPPPLDPTLPPAEALQQTINYYVTNTTTTNVDDRDTNVDSSVNTNVFAEDGSEVDLDIDNETNTASGDGAVAAGDDATGVATGAGAVAAGEDINAPVNTGENSGILADESNIEGNALGDGNQVISDSEGVATGSGDASSVDVDFDNSGDVDLEDVQFGQGNTQDDSVEINDSFNVTDSLNQDNDFIDDSLNQQSQVGDESFNDQEVDESFNNEAEVFLTQDTGDEAPSEETPDELTDV